MGSTEKWRFEKNIVKYIVPVLLNNFYEKGVLMVTELCSFDTRVRWTTSASSSLL